MSDWWRSLSSRDRRLAVFIAWIVWLLAWRPLTQSRERWQDNAVSAEREAAWIQQAANQYQSLSPSTQPVRPRGNQSLFALARETADSRGLGAAFRRGEQDGTQAVQIWLENAPFEALMAWLEQLQRDYAIVVNDASMDRAGTGIVNARLRLVEP